VEADCGLQIDAKVTLHADLRNIHFFASGEDGMNLSQTMRAHHCDCISRMDKLFWPRFSGGAPDERLTRFRQVRCRLWAAESISGGFFVGIGQWLLVSAQLLNIVNSTLTTDRMRKTK